MHANMGTFGGRSVLQLLVGSLVGINRKYRGNNIFILILRHFSALGVFYKGQKNGGRRTKVLPGRQTHFWEFF